jgi:deoxyribodipyrimidine photolyase-related protein
MENFYREMRVRTGLLMDGDEPAGGKWNYDTENRKPAKSDLFMPEPPRFEPDAITRDVIALVKERFADHFGDAEPFWFAVTREDAERARDHFIREALARFGDYQDAMLKDEKFLYHSLLSFYINAGLLDPLDLCRRVEEAYESGDAPLNAVEGFIRQIIGWREYVRGVYWREMPAYLDRNALDAHQPLPALYWTADTDAACVREAVGQVLAHGYGHHIQRLMVTGLFALLLGVEPRQVHAWYLAMFVDAVEWVEAPNTLGMSQYADGGLLASKPYAASGAYIRRMSNYCDGCRFDPGQATGENACPFTTLYWDFLARHRERFAAHPRTALMWRNLERKDSGEVRAIRAQAASLRQALS